MTSTSTSVAIRFRRTVTSPRLISCCSRWSDSVPHPSAPSSSVTPAPTCGWGVQPASLDIRLDRRFRVFRSSHHPYIDLARPLDDVTELVEVGDSPFILHPNEFVLCSTRERIRLPDDLVSLVEGKSSLGRLGLLIHSTAGFIDP